jgi:hypothetical protein
LLPPETLASFEFPVGPEFSTDAGNFAVWIINVAAAGFLIPHLIRAVGAFIDNSRLYRLANNQRTIPPGWTHQSYIEHWTVFSQAMFIFFMGVSMMGILDHFGKLT